MDTLAKKFNCDLCAYRCDKLSEWTKHTATRKHLSIGRKKSPEKYSCCNCNKEYSVRSSLWYHQRKCINNSDTEPDKSPIELEISPQHILENKYIDIVNRLIVDNQRILTDNNDLRNLILEQTKITKEQNNEILNKMIDCCKPVNNTINQTNKFNINVFLNETCKNAMNFSDFVNNIQITYEDLENNARLGFVNGISKIFLDNLNQLDISERPIHCTDVKRETMYIRDDNTWKKQTDDQILQKAIQAVSYKSMGKLAKWKEENPDYMNADSEFSQRCLVIQKHTLAGSERGVYYPKVIHALARETTIDK
jgi:hypothetical protein